MDMWTASYRIRCNMSSGIDFLSSYPYSYAMQYDKLQHSAFRPEIKVSSVCHLFIIQTFRPDTFLRDNGMIHNNLKQHLRSKDLSYCIVHRMLGHSLASAT